MVLSDLNWFTQRGKGKKMYFDEVRFIAKVNATCHQSPPVEWLALRNVVRRPSE
jgi:hypothetical protein